MTTATQWVVWTALLLDWRGNSELSDSCVTPAVMEGPYYVPKSRTKQEICSKSATGRRLTVTGQVRDVDGQKPVPGAVLDVWQADGNGDYSYYSSIKPGECRGRVVADSDGNYRYDTVYPGHYMTGGGGARPAHIHAKIYAQGYRTLTTQFYFANDEYNNDQDHSSDKCAQIQLLPGGAQGTRNIMLSKNRQGTGQASRPGGRGGRQRYPPWGRFYSGRSYGEFGFGGHQQNGFPY